jgi:hypothetical protein
MRRFDSPDKGLRSKTRAGKLCRSNGVGMSVAIDLAVAEAEGPSGPEAHTVLLDEVKTYNEAPSHGRLGGYNTFL